MSIKLDEFKTDYIPFLNTIWKLLINSVPVSSGQIIMTHIGVISSSVQL